MAKVTCARFTFAGITSGGDGSAMVYHDGVMLDDYLAKVDITEERTNDSEYADGNKIDSEKIATGAHMALELVNNNDNIRKGCLGYAEGSDGELLLKASDTPFVGAGCLMANRFKGAITWEGYWFYKIQFSSGGVSAETRRDRTSWQHETINGDAVDVILTENGDAVYYAYKGGMTESAAIAWLKGHAQISESADPSEETTSAATETTSGT